MKTSISALVDYFSVELPMLEKNYDWKIPEISGFNYSGKRDYQSNVALKKFFQESWANAKNDTERFDLSLLIVKDWGGVKNNKPATLENFVSEFSKSLPQLPLKGVASYSKIFSMADLDSYAIYDARVAACLNAVQWNCGVKGLAFNYIPGRNNTTGHAEKKIGFTYQEQFKTDALVRSGWDRIEKDDTYKIYLKLLKECHSHYPNYRLYDLEMILFANAEVECIKAMKAISK
jgi:hypothetical protein